MIRARTHQVSDYFVHLRTAGLSAFYGLLLPFTTADIAASLASQSFLQNPYYFMFATLAKPDEDVELHWLKVRSVVS